MSTTKPTTARTVTVQVQLSVEVDLDAWCVEYGNVGNTAQALTEALQDLGEVDYYLQQTKWQGLARVTAVTVSGPAAEPVPAESDGWEITDYQVAARAVLDASTRDDRIHVLTSPGGAIWRTSAALASIRMARRCEWVAHPEHHDLKVTGSDGTVFFFDVPRPGRPAPGGA